MPTLPSLTERLNEAKYALHLLLIGQQEVEVRDSNGESVRFSQANVSRLKSYIADLESELAGLNPARARRPLRPIWS